MRMEKTIYPFTAVQAQEDFKQCLILCMIDPTIGGVLALGDKGTGKTTTVRALAQLMKKVVNDFSFVNLPIGASEDRVLGSIDLELLLKEKRIEIQKGLLAQANKGILYIDEINLLNDYLMDILLDAASTGGYNLERDNVSSWLESRFCLIGTMNPEEGELRPQLLDRFGLSVRVTTPMDKNVRMKISDSRISYDDNASAFYKLYEEEEAGLAKRIIQAKEELLKIKIAANIKEYISDLCVNNKVEGLRGDIVLMKASRAYAAYMRDEYVNSVHVDYVAPFVLNHRVKNFTSNNSQKNGKDQLPREEKEEYSEGLKVI